MPESPESPIQDATEQSNISPEIVEELQTPELNGDDWESWPTEADYMRHVGETVRVFNTETGKEVLIGVVVVIPTY